MEVIVDKTESYDLNGQKLKEAIWSNTTATSIKISDLGQEPTIHSLDNLFNNGNLNYRTIDFTDFNMSRIYNACYTFYNYQLRPMNIINFDISNIHNLYYTFYSLDCTEFNMLDNGFANNAEVSYLVQSFNQVITRMNDIDFHGNTITMCDRYGYGGLSLPLTHLINLFNLNNLGDNSKIGTLITSSYELQKVSDIYWTANNLNIINLLRGSEAMWEGIYYEELNSCFPNLSNIGNISILGNNCLPILFTSMLNTNLSIGDITLGENTKLEYITGSEPAVITGTINKVGNIVVGNNSKMNYPIINSWNYYIMDYSGSHPNFYMSTNLSVGDIHIGKNCRFNRSLLVINCLETDIGDIHVGENSFIRELVSGNSNNMKITYNSITLAPNVSIGGLFKGSVNYNSITDTKLNTNGATDYFKSMFMYSNNIQYVSFDLTGITDLSNMFYNATFSPSAIINLTNTESVSNIYGLGLDLDKVEGEIYFPNVTGYWGRAIYSTTLLNINNSNYILNWENLTTIYDSRGVYSLENLNFNKLERFGEGSWVDSGKMSDIQFINNVSMPKCYEFNLQAASSYNGNGLSIDGLSLPNIRQVGRYLFAPTYDYYGLNNIYNASLLSINNLNLCNVNNAEYMFSNQVKLTTASNIDLVNCTLYTSAFYNCRNLTNVDNLVFNTTNMININGLFANCINLVNLPDTISNIHAYHPNTICWNCNNLSDASIDKVINMVLNSDISKDYWNYTFTLKNSGSKVYGPFLNTNITNARFSSRLTELAERGIDY